MSANAVDRAACSMGLTRVGLVVRQVPPKTTLASIRQTVSLGAVGRLPDWRS